ncbi:UDP-galactopyranose mutase [Clostridium carboxidivorans P7]|uniref:UDP-galactopyranose mutase n=1 Tax=Clostridium carboxidivorans P7 TaxID=536227 RepID=C6Q256_9CLOT|nr:UDP-galactopyranose mutase [Clostridium carboxidivorans]AKN29706.1 UDP-galactopyranose mutase [Clostridium carboxidivorans P7]EET84428.1 UDP-galactopyranose mutase [Clostridium carboxidivorans P7]EFG89355.1 UDP-galactopyranose mutase [Clostridium carboxidivorans P7]
MNNAYDCLVVGCGLAGAVISRELAEREGKKVLIIEKRSHIGGNTYDFFNEDGILVHKYGPHIFHTNNKRVYDYISRFTEWRDYSHEVLANLHGKLIPVPFNLNSLNMTFNTEKAEMLKKKLVSVYGMGTRLTIAQLRSETDPDLQELADFVYNNVFLYYTQKQWGVTPENIDPSVIARVPVLISQDNRYFQDEYQGMPSDGYTSLFEKLLDNPNIHLRVNTDANELFEINENNMFFEGKPFNGTIIYTGALDEFFNCKFGRLPYRTLDFLFETHDMTWYQPKGTVNYTVDEPFTRITEFKHLTGQNICEKTTIMKEYPKAYAGTEDEIPYYAILNEENLGLYKKYEQLTEKFSNFYLLGRLAEYKYYNMDAIIERALILADKIIYDEKGND